MRETHILIPITSLTALTTDATTTALLVLAVADNTVVRFWGTLIGIDTAHNGSYYSARFAFTAERHGGAGVVIKDTAASTGGSAPLEIIKAGTTSGWLTDAAASGNNLQIRVVGAVATNINWTIRYETNSIS